MISFDMIIHIFPQDHYVKYAGHSYSDQGRSEKLRRQGKKLLSVGLPSICLLEKPRGLVNMTQAVGREIVFFLLK